MLHLSARIPLLETGPESLKGCSVEKPAQVFDKRSGSSLYMFTVLPAPPLRNYIDYYYGEETIIKEYGSRYVPHHLILLPLACVEMHFCYHDTSLFIRSDKAACSFRGLIVGAHNIHTHHIVDNFKDTAKQIHVKFIPGGFHRLLGLRESELQQTFFNTDVVLGSEGKTIEDDLNNSLHERKNRYLGPFFH